MSEIDKILDTREEIDEKQQAEMNQSIRKGIRRNIYSRILAAILVLAVLISGVRYGSRYFRESSAFHLDDLEYLLDDNVITYYGEDLDLNMQVLNAGWYLNCYFELFAPGNVFLLDPLSGTKENHFGSWTVYGYLMDLFHMNPELTDIPDAVGNRKEYEIRDGKLYEDPELTAEIFRKNPFRKWWSGMDTWDRAHKAPDLKEEIESLPDSAWAEIDLRFAQSLDMEEFLAWLSEYKDSMAVYGVTHLYMDKDDGYRIYAQGFSFPRSQFYAWVSEEALKKYPGFDYSVYLYNTYYTTASFVSQPQRELVKEKLLSHYTSSLKLLLENDFLEGVQKDIAQYVFDDLQGNEPEILGARLYCPRTDALKLLEYDNIRNIRIADIKLTRFD